MIARFAAHTRTPLAVALAGILVALAPRLASAELVPVGSRAGISEYRLSSNGLRVLLLPDPSQPKVTVNMTIFVGSAHENYGETGAAHLLEHMVFKGTPSIENVPAALNEHGATWNGTTWTDRTNYYETMPASDENLDFGIRLEADRLVNSHVRGSDLESEMTVVRNEFEMGENFAQSVLSERLVSTSYLFHGYGHSTIGARSDIEEIPIERLQAFYKHYYQPDNAMLIVAGQFEVAKASALIEKYFAPIPKPARKLEPLYTVEPAQDGERSVTLRRVGEVGAVGLLYKVPAGSHSEFAAVDVLSVVLASQPQGRLYQALVETKKAVNVYANASQWRDAGPFEIGLEVRKGGDLESVLHEATRLVEEDLQAHPVTEQEVELARNEIDKRMTLGFANLERLAVELSEWSAMGDWRLYFAHRDRVRAVRAADVAAVAAKYLRRNNRTSGIFVPTAAPERVEIPQVTDLEQTIAAYKADKAGEDVAVAEAFDVAPASLEASVRRSTPFPGLHVATLAKPTRAGKVSARITLYVGNENDIKGRTRVNEYVASMLDRGTKKHSRDAIKAELDRLKADVRIWGGANRTDVSVEALRDTFDEALALAIEMLREPAFDAEEFELVRQEEMASLESSTKEPMALAPTRLLNHLYPKDHVSHVPTLAEQAAHARSLKVEDLARFHADFYQPADCYVGVVGDFDREQVTQALASGLGGWKSRLASRRIDPTLPPAAAKLDDMIETPDKENALTLFACLLDVRRESPDYQALLMANEIFGGSQLASRISTRLRQKDGLCYGAGSNTQADERSNVGSFFARAISAPQNVAAVKRGFWEELDRIRAEGVGDEELAKAKEGYLQEIDVALARDGALASMLVSDQVRGKTFDELASNQAKIRALTKAEVDAAVRKYFVGENLNVVAAGDFEKVRASAGEAVSKK